MDGYDGKGGGDVYVGSKISDRRKDTGNGGRRSGDFSSLGKKWVARKYQSYSRTPIFQVRLSMILNRGIEGGQKPDFVFCILCFSNNFAYLGRSL